MCLTRFYETKQSDWDCLASSYISDRQTKHDDHELDEEIGLLCRNQLPTVHVRMQSQRLYRVHRDQLVR